MFVLSALPGVLSGMVSSLLHRAARGWVAVALIAGAGLISACAADATNAAPSACANAAESEALSVRVLQNDLMVGALSCGQQQGYNSFVTKFKGEMQKQSEAFRGYFERNYVGGANRQMNDFVTAMANQSSQSAAKSGGASYCNSVSSLYREVMDLSPSSLGSYAKGRSSSNSHGIKTCAGK